MTYTEEQINAAIARVETAKQNHPVGWRFLAELNLPADDTFIYAFNNGSAHAHRLRHEKPDLIYAAAWLNGLAVGIALGEQHDL
jgi:hypothetical protein